MSEPLEGAIETLTPEVRVIVEKSIRHCMTILKSMDYPVDEAHEQVLFIAMFQGFVIGQDLLYVPSQEIRDIVETLALMDDGKPNLHLIN